MVIFIALFATYFIVYQPLNNQLKIQTYENYKITAAQREMLVEQFIERSVEGANSLSSRTFIRNAIQNYHDEHITLTELSNLTQPIYEDGFNALINVASATRVVDGMMIAQVNESLDNTALNSVAGIMTTKYEMVITNHGLAHVKVISPIVNNDTIIGHDIVTFDMSRLMEELNDGEVLLSFLSAESRTMLYQDAQVITHDQAYLLLVKDEHVIYVSDALLQRDDILYITVSISQNLLEQDINRLTRTSLLWSGFLVVTSLFIVVLINRKSTLNRLSILNDKRILFQEKANKDALTGLYSRHYLRHKLDQFKENFSHEMMPIAVVMSDINGFKKFNDTYGHQAGDQALIDIARIFKTMIRENDLLIRYGGDEFLLLFTQVNPSQCESIMQQINDAIVHEFKDNNISLAYGYVIVNDANKIEVSIDMADKKMYEYKRKITI